MPAVLLAAVGTALGFVLLWPLRRLRRRAQLRRTAREDAAARARR